MARKLRVEYPGAIYHVLSRGDRREPIFLDDEDRRKFLATLAEACAKTGWQADRMVAEELQRRKWVEADLDRLAKGDEAKVAMALRLRTETVMTVKWIAERLKMGTAGYLNHLLQRQRKKTKEGRK